MNLLTLRFLQRLVSFFDTFINTFNEFIFPPWSIMHALLAIINRQCRSICQPSWIARASTACGQGTSGRSGFGFAVFALWFRFARWLKHKS